MFFSKRNREPKREETSFKKILTLISKNNEKNCRVVAGLESNISELQHEIRKQPETCLQEESGFPTVI